jgi:hypothetical protein
MRRRNTASARGRETQCVGTALPVCGGRGADTERTDSFSARIRCMDLVRPRPVRGGRVRVRWTARRCPVLGVDAVVSRVGCHTSQGQVAADTTRPCRSAPASGARAEGDCSPRVCALSSGLGGPLRRGRPAPQHTFAPHADDVPGTTAVVRCSGSTRWEPLHREEGALLDHGGRDLRAEHGREVVAAVQHADELFEEHE